MATSERQPRFAALRERFRIAWSNRCLICLFNPFHGKADEGQRYEITVLFGPCSDVEAETLLNNVADSIYGGLCGEAHGAVCALHPWSEPEAANRQASPA